MAKANAELVYEVSWEVCNKVGGIWTVISSKASQMRRFYKDRYTCIGPYFAEKALGSFEEESAPEECKAMCKELEKQGIVLHFGKWLIKGTPNIILIDFTNFRFKTDEIKKELWYNFKVDSINSNSVEYNEPIVWSYAAGIVIEKLSQIYNKKIVAQFHEWLAGPGLLYLKKNNANVATVFTTHATVMGRALASANIDLFCKPKGTTKCNLQLMDIDKESYNYHTEGKHLIEKASAHNTDIFTTVSEITGLEAEYVLGVKPHKILPNGLDGDKFPTFEEASIEHRIHRNQVREFIMYYFFPHYQFDIKETLIFFLAGRYELRNKGIDIFIKALAKLNGLMKEKKSKKTIIAFIWVPTGVRGVKLDILDNRTLFKDIKDGLEEDTNQIKRSILYTVLSKQELSKENIFARSFLDDTKRKLMKFRKKGTPPLITHDLQQYGDQIVNLLLESGLDNKEDDKVKIIFYPIYLTGADGLLDLTYYESMQAGHLGVFPSFYEPWGYTPLEAAALGVSSVTTDLAGFGKYIQKKKQKRHPGIFVLRRMDRTDDEIVDDLTRFMHKFTRYTRQGRVKNKIEAKKLAEKADWKRLSVNYIIAHNSAVQKRYG
jgi:glycogen(starch) synthase